MSAKSNPCTVYCDTIQELSRHIADKFDALAQEANELRELLKEVMAYREGRKPYDFHRLQSESDRDNAAFDAWTNIEQRICTTLAKYPKS